MQISEVQKQSCSGREMGMGYGGNLKAQSFEDGWAFFYLG